MAECPESLKNDPSLQNLLSALIGLKELGTKLDDGMIDVEYLKDLEKAS